MQWICQQGSFHPQFDRCFLMPPHIPLHMGMDIANDENFIALMAKLVKEKPELWAEDIAE